MAASSTPDDDALLASLHDLGGRIAAARSTPPPNGHGRRRARTVLGLLAIVVGLLTVGFALAGGDDDAGDDREVAAGQRPTTTAAPATTEADAAPDTTAGPTTTAVPATTAAPVTTAVPATTAAAPTTTAPPAPATTAPPPPAAPDPSAAAPPPAPVAGPAEVAVVAGDSFWTIAEDRAAAELGRAPTVGEVTTVWVDLLAANADRLVDPGNPDLILPGQVLVVPGAAS